MAIAQWLSPAAAAALVQNGQTVALGGFTIYRRPVAFVRELLRRDPRPKDLTLLCFTAGFESDLLVGAGCIKTMRTVYFGLEFVGFAPMFTEKANRGEIDICEETESSLAMGLRARMAGVGFMPSTALDRHRFAETPPRREKGGGPVFRRRINGVPGNSGGRGGAARSGRRRGR